MIWSILVGFGIFIVAFLFGWFLRTRLVSHDYDGSVLIMKYPYPDDRTVYRLELNKDPEGWQLKKEVLLEVVVEEVRE